MKTLITSNFNLLNTNKSWNKLKKLKIKFSEYNQIQFDLNNSKKINDSDIFVGIVYLNTINQSQVSLLKKLISSSSQKFYKTKFIFKFLTQQFNNSEFDNKNIMKKNYLESFLIKKKFNNLYILNKKNDYSFSSRNNFLIRCPLRAEDLDKIVDEIEEKISILKLKPFKLIILDCDNTLWGGITGEDGFQNLKYGEDGEGQIFKEVQSFLKKIKSKGFILSIASKNNKKIVWETFLKRKMILQKNDFLFPKINWEEKYVNIKQILKQMNIKEHDALFIDDSEIERLKVKKKFPNIQLLDSSELSNYHDKLFGNKRLQKINLTADDKNKYKQYKLKNKFEEKVEKLDNNLDHHKFFKELKQKIIWHKVDSSNILRTEQLFNKVNQFNLTSNRYDLKNISKLKKEKKLELFSLKDKFGDHGIVGLIVYEVFSKKLLVTDFLISCRVLSRKVEEYIILQILKRTRRKQIDILFKKNDKNKEIVTNFLKKNNYKKISRSIFNKKNYDVYNFKINKKNLKVNECFE
jgi:FkbH-like protein